MRHARNKSRGTDGEAFRHNPASQNGASTRGELPDPETPSREDQATGPEVHINNPEWLELLGSGTLPVKSFTPETIRNRQDKTQEVYFVDLARLTPLQRGGILFAFQIRTGRLTSDLWQELNERGLPIPAADCTPIVA